MQRFNLLIILILVLTACQKPEEKSSGVVNEAAKARIDSTFKSMIDSGMIAGVSALIFEDNEEVYYNAFGFEDREAGKKFDRETIVRIF
jgi:hypothetical protein